MRVVLSGGGTGGHVYPALSVAEALRRRAPNTELMYLGTKTGAERQLAHDAGLSFRVVHAGQIRGKSPWHMAGGFLRLAWGVADGLRALGRQRPDVVFVTGGYASVPVALAAKLMRRPLVVFLPDVFPGWAVRFSMRMASLVATTTDTRLTALPAARQVVTGYPIRPEFWEANRQAGRLRLGLDPDSRVLLVSGASQGSMTLNDAIAHALPALLRCCEVVHLTGQKHEQPVRAAASQLPADLQARYHVYGYMPDIAWAMASADLAVLRAGASCLAEPAAVALPTILVPGTYAGGHQRDNAEFMARNGAAVVLQESQLDRLCLLVERLFSTPEELRRMSNAARTLARPHGAESLAALLINVAKAEPASEVIAL